ncbi:MAG: carbohydrate kinase [Leptolyngbyaceae cyanobacterium bins.59]|nr:carbohydrate kinase [Leptolyngbyaceae cyanobacterium bins.59]
MTPPRVLCLGEVLFDALADQPERTPDQVESWTAYPGGAPANVACGLAKLGTSSGFIGCVGQDVAGTELKTLLETLGVDITGIQTHPTAPTRTVLVTRSQSGERTFAGFKDCQTTEFADTFLQASQLSPGLFEKADFLVLGTLELAYPDSRAAIERSLALAEQNYVKILVDVNWRSMFWPDLEAAQDLVHWLLKQVDFLKLSDEEADWLFGTADPGAITHRLGNLEGVLVTAGGEGCAYCLGENEGRLPAFSVTTVDTTGAGDSFVAGVLHQFCQQGIRALSDPAVARQVAAYASAVGALTTLNPGAIAAQPTAAAVEAFLAGNPI